MMSRHDKALATIMRGNADANLRFAELCGVLAYLGFETRVRGDHHIFWKEGIPEIVNLQPLPDGKAKAYQVRQVRGVILRHRLGGSDDEV